MTAKDDATWIAKCTRRGFDISQVWWCHLWTSSSWL